MRIEIHVPQQYPAYCIALLEQLFADRALATVTKHFTEGQSGTFVFLVEPTRQDGEKELPVVVKIGPRHLLEQEWRAAQDHIASRLPDFVPISGQLATVTVTAADGSNADYSAARYQLAGNGLFAIATLRDYATTATSAALWTVLAKRLFAQLDRIWANKKAPATRSLGAIYDRVLPVNLLLEFAETEAVVSAAVQLDATQDPATYPPLQPGDWVQLNNFVISEIDEAEQALTLNLPQSDALRTHAYRLRIRQVANLKQYKLDATVSRLTGRVLSTRQNLLHAALRPVLPAKVDLARPVVQMPDSGIELPNPLAQWPSLLQEQLSMRSGTVHGDLNTGNVLIDVEAKTTFLIDCAHAHEDHVLYDLVRLESEVLLHLVATRFFELQLPPTTIYALYGWLDYVSQRTPTPAGSFSVPQPLLQTSPALESAFIALTIIRNHARQYLAGRDQWREYYAALALTLLGSLKFASLDRTPAGTNPKAVAFWGAATLLAQLEQPADFIHLGWRRIDLNERTSQPNTPAGAPPNVYIDYGDVTHDQRQGVFFEGNQSVTIGGNVISGGTVNTTNFQGPVTGPIHTGSGDIHGGGPASDVSKPPPANNHTHIHNAEGPIHIGSGAIHVDQSRRVSLHLFTFSSDAVKSWARDFFRLDEVDNHTLSNSETSNSMPSDEPPAQRRLDVAAPEKATLNRSFDLAVAVRLLTSPPQASADLPAIYSGNAQLDWPKEMPFVRLRVQVIATECEINGSSTHSIKLYRNRDSEIFYFSLTPKVTGRLSIIVYLYQEEDMLGSTLAHTTVGEQIVSEVKLQLHSDPVTLKADGSITNQVAALPPAQRQSKILFLTANPFGTDRLRTDEEVRAIDQVLRQAEYRSIEMAVHLAVRISDLQDLLLRHRPDIVHFSGHGSAANELILQDDNGNAVPVSGKALHELFASLKDKIRCVVLNACYTEEQARHLAKVIDCVVGSSHDLTDQASIQFATAFYRALGYGRSVQDAFRLGQSQIKLAGLGEGAALHLHGADAAQTYFVHARSSWAGMTLYLLGATMKRISDEGFLTFLLTALTAALAIWFIAPILAWPQPDAQARLFAAVRFGVASLVLPLLIAVLIKPEGTEKFPMHENATQRKLLALKLAGAWTGFGALAGTVLTVAIVWYHLLGSPLPPAARWILALLPLFFAYVSARRIPLDRYKMFKGELRLHDADPLFLTVFAFFGTVLAALVYGGHWFLINQAVMLSVLLGIIGLTVWEIHRRDKSRFPDLLVIAILGVLLPLGFLLLFFFDMRPLGAPPTLSVSEVGIFALVGVYMLGTTLVLATVGVRQKTVLTLRGTFSLLALLLVMLGVSVVNLWLGRAVLIGLLLLWYGWGRRQFQQWAWWEVHPSVDWLLATLIGAAVLGRYSTLPLWVNATLFGVMAIVLVWWAYRKNENAKQNQPPPETAKNSPFFRWDVVLFVVIVMIGIILVVRNFIGTDSPRPTPTGIATNAPTVAATINPTPSPTSSATATLTATSALERLTVARPASGANRYFIEGPNLARYALEDMLAVYAQDAAGLEFDAAVVLVVDKNVGNLIVQVIFQNEDHLLDSLSALQLDDQLDDVDLASMTPINSSFVGFMLNDETIRLVADAPIEVGDQLEAVQLTRSGDTLPFPDGPRRVHIDSIGTDSKVAGVSSSVALPPLGTLLVFTPESPTGTPSLTPSPTQVVTSIVTSTSTPSPLLESTPRIIRPGIGENEYIIMGEGIELYNPFDFLVVYAQDAAGYEFDAAILYVVAVNEDNLIAKVIFLNSDLWLDLLVALPVDNNFGDVDLKRMVSVDDAFVGFTIENGVVKINPNMQIPIGTELIAVRLTSNGDALITSPPLTLQVDSVSDADEMAKVSIVGFGSWPPKGTLLIPSNPRHISRTYIVSINGYTERDDICVHEDDKVMIRPSGEASNSALLYRIEGEANWQDYSKAKQFIARRAGCLEFDINITDNDEISATFNGLVEVQPEGLY